MPTKSGNSQHKWDFLSKGRTLKSMYGCLRCAHILPCLTLSRLETLSWAPEDFAKVFIQLKSDCLVVRSSHSKEDSTQSSMAGIYESVLNVTTELQLKEAIGSVFASYPKGFCKTEEVLIQPALKNVKHCGVVFTRDQQTNSPYMVVSDDTSGQTDVVTSGKEGITTTYYLYKNHPAKLTFLSKLSALCEELIKSFNNSSLDIEYAIDNKQTLYLLQVRPLLVPKLVDSPQHPNFDNDKEYLRHKRDLDNIRQKIASLMAPHPFLFGETSVLGVMPDWNPAEIIGLYPRPLALSLYKNLITDSIWAYQRDNYGYRNLRSFPLLVDFFGIPYIDVRVSFNSFIPRSVPRSLATKLVNYYVHSLKQKPQSHDSVEFDIVLSCYTLDIDEKLKLLESNGFSETECTEIASHLKSLTNKIIDPRTGLWIQDLHRIEELKQRQVRINDNFDGLISRIYWRLEDCKRYGTLPFAGLARAAFIAVQLLQSLQQKQVITQQQYQKFIASLNTVSGAMQSDLTRLDKESFLLHYGHLRPGTYDVLSPRYDQKPDQYFNWPYAQTNEQVGPEQEQKHSSTTENGINAETFAQIDELLSNQGINHRADSLLHFIKCAIEGREYAKFIFTRSLSDAMEDFVALGEQYGFDRQQMSFANINVINQLITSSDDIANVLDTSIQHGKRRYAKARAIKLPSLICSPDEVYEFKLTECQPSFITAKTVQGKIVQSEKHQDMNDKIVFISSADPGYDWIFSHNIKGFVTAFGGCNSHMAIRAGELNVAAVIGAGEENFKKWQMSEILKLDCENQSVTVIKKCLA